MPKHKIIHLNPPEKGKFPFKNREDQRAFKVSPPFVKGGPGGILDTKQYYALSSNRDRADHVGGITIERSLIHGCGIIDDMVLM